VRFVLFLAAVLSFPALAQDRPKKPAPHAKPTPQQIRKFNELEKKEHQGKIRGRSPNSAPPDSKRKTVRAPSPK
jgi:hypothetical protein